MLSKKILIDGAEAYIQSNKNPAGEVTITWIVNSVLRRITLVRVNHDFITDVMKYEFMFEAEEITGLNGFDYLADDPNYSLIETMEISAERAGSSINIPNLSFQSPSTLSPITSVSVFPINDAFRKHFGAAQEGIFDFSTGQFRQPFYYDPIIVHETAENADDGEIILASAWGGDAALEYSIDDGATWQAGDTFSDLVPGEYIGKVKDGAGNESESTEIEVSPFA